MTDLTLPARLALLDAAYALHVDLCNQIDHVAHALDFLHRGEWLAAHWSFWRSGMTRVQPLASGYEREESTGT